MLMQEQVPGGNNPLFTLLCCVQLCHATAWTGSCFFTGTSVILLLRNTLHAKFVCINNFHHALNNFKNIL